MEFSNAHNILQCYLYWINKTFWIESIVRCQSFERENVSSVILIRIIAIREIVMTFHLLY